MGLGTGVIYVSMYGRDLEELVKYNSDRQERNGRRRGRGGWGWRGRERERVSFHDAS